MLHMSSSKSFTVANMTSLGNAPQVAFLLTHRKAQSQARLWKVSVTGKI